MKKTIVYMIFLSLLFGCGKTYDGEVIKDKEQEIIVEPMPVLMSIGEVGNFAQFKGSGLVTGICENKLDSILWLNSKFYIYAFSQKTEGSEVDYRYNWNSGDNIGERYCLIDATRVAENSYSKGPGGKEAVLSEVDMRTLTWADNLNVLYNTVDFGKAYDFFVYYVDDYEVQDRDVHREREYVYIDVEIDGQRDLLGAKAIPTKRQLDIIDKKNGSLSYDLNNMLYSTNTAIFNINPSFQLKHYLSKVSVVLYPGGVLSEKGPDSPCYEPVVTVRGESKSLAKMVVATSDEEKYPLGATFYDGQSYASFDLMYKELKGDGKIENIKSSSQLEYNEADVDISDVYKRSSLKMPGELLMAPDRDLRLFVNMDNETEEIPLVLDPPEGYDSFLPGMSYVVRVAVYGRQNISATVDVNPWNEGEDIEITPDL